MIKQAGIDAVKRSIEFYQNNGIAMEMNGGKGLGGESPESPHCPQKNAHYIVVKIG
jgi:hypothetical protein